MQNQISCLRKENHYTEPKRNLNFYSVPSKQFRIKQAQRPKPFQLTGKRYSLVPTFGKPNNSRQSKERQIFSVKHPHTLFTSTYEQIRQQMTMMHNQTGPTHNKQILHGSNSINDSPHSNQKEKRQTIEELDTQTEHQMKTALQKGQSSIH